LGLVVVSIILLLHRIIVVLVVGALLLLGHGLLLAKFLLSVSEATLSFIRALTLLKVLAELGFVVCLTLGIHIRPLLLLPSIWLSTVHATTHLLDRHALILYKVVGAWVLWARSKAASTCTAAASEATSISAWSTRLDAWLLVGLRLELCSRGVVEGSGSTWRRLIEVTVALGLTVATSACIVAHAGVEAATASSSGSASTAPEAVVLRLRVGI
jgi:hypothetical protein